MGFDDEPTGKNFPDPETFRGYLKEKGSYGKIFTFKFELGENGELVIYPFAPGSNGNGNIPGHPVADQAREIIDAAAFFDWPNARVVDNNDPGNLCLVSEPTSESDNKTQITTIKKDFDPFGTQTKEDRESDKYEDARYG